MHVLMTVNAAWNIWNFRRPVVEALINDGYKVTVLAPYDKSVPDLERLGCRFLHLKMNLQGLNPIDDLRLARRFMRVFRQERPDIVISYTIRNNIFGAWVARVIGIPFLPNVTGLGTAFLNGSLLKTVSEYLYRQSFKALPIVFFQNADDSALFIEHAMIRREQVRLLPGSGIDLLYFAPAPMPCVGEPPTFLMIARLLRDKGVLEFIDAARQVKATHPDARFQLLGAVDSANRSAIDAATVQRWVAEDVVEYLGTTSDVRPAIAAASCVVLPSYREGAPRTLIEAAAMARPVIATDVPGCRAVVDRDLSGFLCEVRSAKSLAATMNQFIAFSPESSAAMGQAGRAKMEREYDHAYIVQAYREAISSLLSSSRGS